MAIWHRPSSATPAGRSRKERRTARRRSSLEQALRRTQIEKFEPRQMLAVSPQLVSIIPSAGDILNLDGLEVRNQEFRELTFRFDEGQRIDEITAQRGGIQVIRAGGDGVLGNGNEVDVTPNTAAKSGFIGIGDRPNEIVVRFADHLPDDLYQIRIIGAGAVPLRNVEQLPFNNGTNRSVNFELDLGPQVIAVVPQPIRRVGGQLQQARNEIEVYFNNDDLNQTAATNTAFYQLIRTRRTANNLDDGAAIRPTSVIYDPIADKVRLTFASDLAALDNTESVYRLRIGNRYNEPLPPIVVPAGADAGDMFSNATNLSNTSPLDTRTIVVKASIDPLPYGLNWPGGIDEPGHRDVPVEVHVFLSDADDGVETIAYNFRDDYGTDPSGNPLHNLITEAQKQRVREVFEYYERYLGVQFVETPTLGFTIVTGDLRALDPNVETGPGGVIGLAGGTLAIMDNAEDWGLSEPGGGYFTTAMHEIGHLLGYGHTYDLPPLTVMGDDAAQGGGQDPSFPGDNDLVHGRHLHRPESIDIDLYRFRLDQAGAFSAESVAERLGDSSFLDSVVWVFNSTGELIARNDDYLSEDAFVELELQPGDYYVAVTSTGMSEINPRIAESGIGGTSQGPYELRLSFKPSPERMPTSASGLVDIDGTPTLLDGDVDGQPGGEYNFWFASSTAANTLIVDKSAAAGGSGSLASPFNNIPAAFAAATARNGDGNSTNDVRIVRIVGNGGTDGNLATLRDNAAYEVGFNSLGQALSDGTDMQVPKGVTVMIDAGAIFKLRRANIDVGSRSQGVDRSEGHLQVLGTPTDRVYFTSYHNETLGRDTFALPTTPAGGDWGGIVIRNELDYDSRRMVLENEGIFINYVNHANFTFGGGESATQPGISVSPIHLNEARPSLSFNTITISAGAAIGADPNSFKDDLFNEVGRSFFDGRVTIVNGIATLTGGIWPEWAAQGTLTVLTFQGPSPELRIESRLSNTQLRLSGTVGDVTNPESFGLAPPPFTADYRRIGPEIYFNTVRDNSINGLFVQIDTRGGEPIDKLEVAARFNDTDIVHVLSENLIIQGTPGGGELTTFTGARIQQRSDGRLRIDPGIIVKLDRARIETQIGAQLIAEGLANNRVVFTSLLDDRFGASGTFDTAGRDLGPFSQGTVSALNGVVTLTGGVWPSWAAGAILTVNGIDYTIATRDSDTQVTLTRTTVNFVSSPFVLTKDIVPVAGDWGGLYFGPVSQGSVDHSLITFAGGTTSVEGGFATFNAVEIQQADVRITNSFLEDNAIGTGTGRGVGRFNNDEAVIYVRGAQPVIVGNIIRDNDPGNPTAAISINVNALNSELNHDLGRSTGPLGRTGDFVGNFGPLIRNNRIGGTGVNGMVVRGSTLTTQSVWDDTDIVHVVNDEIVVQNHHTYSGLRLQSSASASLVVKLNGTTAGFTANGVPIDIDDRIGGTVQVIGTPGHPVVLTSAFDSTVGAGLDPDGRPQNETVAGAKAPLTASSQFDIQFRMSVQNQNNAALIAALNLAAATWEAFLDDPITVVLDIEFADLGPTFAGLAFPIVQSRAYDEVRQLMIDDAGANEAIVEQLPTFAQLQTQFPDLTYTVNPTMDLARANLAALGVPASQLSAQPSIFDPLTPIDGTMRFSTTTTYDFNPSDGITQGAIDFVAVTAHELGHALGFLSAVDAVDAGFRNVSLTPLDLFRLAPGNGATDFTNAPRLLAPAAPEHVFFDGGVFNRAGITVPPLTQGDIPLSRGTNTGDGFQASHWKDLTLMPGVTQEIGIMAPSIVSGVRNRVTFADTRAFDLIGYNAVSRGSPADWRSIKLDRYSNDRNVETVTERESGEQNSTPESAQQLGQLARAEGFDARTGQQGGSDDQRRLGFEIHGLLGANQDVDVYSFNATAGSEIWIDIDRTTHSLDSIVELIDASGAVIARSNDSHLERQGLAPLFVADPSVIVESMAREVFSTDDLYTTNPRDAGLRIILPGPAPTIQRYFVRVRSNSADLTDVDGGQTRGAYQLQLRVRELDEIPGSTVRNADIRFASNAIEVLGAPGHSPLLGESSETTANNNDLANAQDLGNLLVQERQAMSVASVLSTWDDLDWYRVEVNWANIQVIPPNTGMLDDNTASLIFDMDYADGAGRPDTNIAIFDEQGRLIFLGGSSNVTDDKVPSGIGSGMNDLSRGSFGEFDPFIGPLHLPANANKTYFVAVSSDVRLPSVMSTNPAVRREPLSHIRRLVDDRVGSSWVPPVLGDPMPPPGTFFDPAQIDVYPDPWQLNDVALYVITGDQLMTVDPLTGQLDSFVGFTPGIQPERFGYGDLAMRLDGRLQAFTLGDDDGNSGNLHELDWHGPAFGANPLDVPVTNIGDDGIVPTIMGMGTNAGVQLQAMVFQGIGQGSTLWAVGSVDQPNLNYLWDFDQANGMARPDQGGGGGGGGGSVDPANPRPEGPIDMTDPLRMPPIVEALDTEADGGPGGLITGMSIINGVMYFVSEAGGFYKREAGMFEFVTLVEDAAGDPVEFSGLTAGPPRVEGSAYAEIMFATDASGNLYALNVDGELQPYFPDSATSVQIPGAAGARGLAFSTLDYNLWHVTSKRNQDAGHGLDLTPDRVRTRRIQGGSSFNFGLERNAGQPGAANYDFNPAILETYDLPGGSHGSLTTNTFSLAGYAFGDSPTLYFTYHITHDTLVDSFRVFIANDGADWTFLAQTPLPPSPPFPVDDNGFDEDLLNVADWRQARLDLSPFFGQDNLRLRFEFSTEGGRRQGDLDVGEPLAALPGGDLEDGQFFTLSTGIAPPGPLLNFEFDMGFSLVVPNGGPATIVDGETFTLTNGTGASARFELDDDGVVTPGNIAVPFSITDSADDIIVALDQAIATALDANMMPLNIVTHIFQNRINLENVDDVVQSAGAALLVTGDAPGTVAPMAVPVVIFADMTAAEVAEAMALAIDAGFAAAAGNTDDPAIFTSTKLIKDFVQVIGHLIVDPGPLVYDPLFVPDFTGDPDPAARNINEDAKENAFEGIYLDDFVIGFTERGEMVLNTAPDTSYTLPNPVPLGKVLTGAYQLEMRRGTNYGIPVPPTLTDPPGFQLTRHFNTNHRFGDSLVLIAPEPQLIHAGATFTVGDGVSNVTFEFDLTGLGVSPGNRPVFVSGARTAAEVADAIRDAINAVGPPSSIEPDALVTVADVALPFLNIAMLTTEFHSPFVMLHRVANFETDPDLSGIIIDTLDIGDHPGIVNEGTNFLKEIGDTNVHRDQGQLIIQGNSITGSFGYGILVDAGARNPGSNLPHPGAPRHLQDFNTQRLAPSVTITNNLIANNSAGGIFFSGDTGVDPLGAVPFGRLINNTIFGGLLPGGIGIDINENASPTLLNNVVANLLTGIQVDASSATTVIGGTVYHRNTNNTVGTGIGTFPILVPPGTEIFVDSANGNFIPIAGSPLIDSSINTLQDRPALTTLMGPLGFAPSPILAPERDQLGQLRVNDPAVPSPPGLGADVFKDRGALERGDFSGPTAALIDPVSDAVLDPGVTTLAILETEPVLEFAIQLTDGVQPADPQFGSGIDDGSVFNDRVLIGGVERIIRRVKLLRDGVELVESLDYVFSYDATNNVIHLRPTQGVWTPGHVYRIVLDNSPVIALRFDNTPVTGIRDLSGNLLKANNLQGTTEFVITIDPADFGDAPAQYPTLFADDGAHHRIVAGRHLGATVTAEVNGQPSQGALTDLGDDGVLLPATFVVGESRQITVTASTAGRLDAWIDFNRDGDWNDAGEQIFTNRSLVAGPNTLPVTVPSGSVFGESYARFRFSSAGGLAPTGPAADGEVEDYRLDIQAVASYTLDLKYTNDKELYRDLLNRYFVAPGLQIIAEVYVDDNRSVGAAGVRQAFADLIYDNDLIDFDPASLQHGPTFTSGRDGTVVETGQMVDEGGGIAPVQPASAERQLLFRVRGTVKTDALAEQTFRMRLDQADVTPAHDTLLFGSSQPVQASYDEEMIVVKANAWQNAANRFDVNHNGFITGLDALTIINRLNLQGPAVLPLPGESIPTDNPPTPLYPTPFYDVNGDGRVTAADALAVINELNAGRGGAIVMAAGDDDQSIVATPALAAASNDAGVRLASSLDVTPLAISVAGSGSTAVAPAIVAAENKRSENSAAVASAIVELFSDEDDSDNSNASVRSSDAPLPAEARAEFFVDGGPLNDEPVFVIDRPSPASTGAAPALESMLGELGLESIGNKKKWRFY